MSRFDRAGCLVVKACPISLTTFPVRESSWGTSGYFPPVVVYLAFASRWPFSSPANMSKITPKKIVIVTAKRAYVHGGTVSAVAPRHYIDGKVDEREDHHDFRERCKKTHPLCGSQPWKHV